MSWAVETLDAVVDAEVEALPSDMRAHLTRISFMVEEFGLERVREPHIKHLKGPLGDAFTGQERNIKSALCHDCRQAGHHRPGFREEDREDAQPGNRSGVEPS